MIKIFMKKQIGLYSYTIVQSIITQHVAVSAGSSQRDLDKLKDIISQVPVNFICLDVANGYSEHFVAFVKKVRESYPSKTIIAGNV